MKIVSTYSVKIIQYRTIFQDTIRLYRNAVDFFIDVCLKEWDLISTLNGKQRNNKVESLSIVTKKRLWVPYDFSKTFYKFPSYLRRAAISEAIGKVDSYKSNLKNWMASKQGKKPGIPKAGRIFPAMYRDNMYIRLDDYTARIKVFTRNTWDWVTVQLKKSDVDYIQHHCQTRDECVPTLQKRGREWFLDFPFKEECRLIKTSLKARTILAVDLGINQACVCTAMKADGTILGRRFLSFPREKDSLNTAVNRIKKAQQHGATRTPRLWAIANGINKDISVKTADFIMKTAEQFHTDVIVFEYLEFKGKKKGRKKQRLHLWRKRDVQKIVTVKAHRLGIRISRVNAGGTSLYAYDGSGKIERNINHNYSICRFQTGKTYHCDLNASYNIGARYFIREHLKSLPEKERLGIEAKVPLCTRRNTRTLSTLINLYAVLCA